jgi:hypothetical protein
LSDRTLVCCTVCVVNALLFVSVPFNIK